MKITATDLVSLTFQPLLRQGHTLCAFTASAGFQLLDGSAIPASDSMGMAMRALPENAILDSGIPKQYAEWLVAGEACAPEGTTVSRQRVHLDIAGKQRSFLVGDGKHPFTSLPLTWENTWGEPQSPTNPLGCGLKPDPATGVKRTPLVTGEAEGHGVAACPGPLGAWPCRMSRMGTYDAQWLKTRWPAFPDDMDWSFFNLAQKQQRLAAPLRGGERYNIIGMHPKHTTISGTISLPDIQLEILRTGQEKWERVPLILDTLWFFPGELAGMLLWHGETVCANEAATDIVQARLRTPEAAMNAAPPLAQTVQPQAAAAGATGMSTAAKVAAGLGAAAVVSGAAAMANAQTHTDKQAAEDTAQESKKSPEQQDEAAQDLNLAPPTLTATEMAAEMQRIFQEQLADINTALAEINQPPLSPAQQAEVQQRIIDNAQQITNILEQADAPLPDLDTLLAEKGLPPEQIAAVKTAIDLPIPQMEDFPNSTAWAAAATAHMKQINALLNPSEEVAERAAKSISLMAASMEGDPASALDVREPSSLTELLKEKGLPPTQAQALEQTLNQPIPVDQGFSGLTAYGHMVEQQAGLPAGSITGHLQKMHNFLAEQGVIEAEPTMAAPEKIPPQPLQPPKADEDKSMSAEQKLDINPQEPAPTEDKVAAATAEQDVQPHQAAKQTEQASAKKDAAPNTHGGLLLAGILATAGTLVGAKLAGKCFAHVDFGACDLRGADLTGADLTSANCSGCDFRGAILKDAQAGNSQWVDAKLDKAILDGIHAPDADFSRASLIDASAVAANFSKGDFTETAMQGLHAPRSIYTQAQFPQAVCTGAVFSEANFHRVDADAAILDNVDFSKANCQGMSMNAQSSLLGATCNNANLKDCSWEGVPCAASTFTGAAMSGARLEDCDLSATSLAAVSARGASFARANLTQADMRGMDLFQASLREAQAEGADCSFASLYGADLHRFAHEQNYKATEADFTCTIVDARRKA